MKYCVYLTTYRGNKLPPFYIGSSNVKRIQEGYIGSVSSREYKVVWNEEKKNHPELFHTRIISYCKTRDEAYVRENYFHTILDVVNNPMYCNKWYACLIKNYTPKYGKDNPMYGKSHSTSTKRKIAEAHTGRKAKTTTRLKLKESHKARRTENAWFQIKDRVPQYSSYEDFSSAVLMKLTEYCFCPSLVAPFFGISVDAVITYCKHNDIPYSVDEKFTKIVKKHGNRWNSYIDYENEIVKLHMEGCYLEQIITSLDVSHKSVENVLLSRGLNPLKRSELMRDAYSTDILTMYNDGNSINKIRKELKITEYMVRKVLIEHGFDVKIYS